jgi:hypothetical protein
MSGRMALQQSMRADLRRVRAQLLLAEVMRIVRGEVPDCEEVYESDCLRAITRKLEDLFRQDGVEVLTDYTRQEMGLPPRGPDGWTIEEIHAMERLRLERMTAPLPMFIPLPKAGTP